MKDHIKTGEEIYNILKEGNSINLWQHISREKWVSLSWLKAWLEKHSEYTADIVLCFLEEKKYE